jgi:tRNA (guanosine-2'-O-)-methyltransferase
VVNEERIARVRAALDRRLGSVVAVAEGVRRRHNVSAILRSCEAFGVHEVHVIDPGFRAAHSAARGAERWVEARAFATTGESIAELRARGFSIYAADLDPAAVTPEAVPVDRPIAVVFGSELRGVSDEARARVDGSVIVPMLGLTESLNVAVSASIILRAIADRRRALVGADLAEERRVALLAEWIEG